MSAVAADLARSRDARSPKRPRPVVVPAAQELPPRRWGRWLLAVLLLLVLGFAAVTGWRVLVSAQLFPLQAVRLDGQLQYVLEKDVEQAMLPYLDRGMLGLDVSAIRRSLDALPWVAKAGVRRDWPATLEVTIVEQVPLALWNGREVVNPRAQLFRPAPASIPPELPRLRGPEGSEQEVVARFDALQEKFGALGFALTALELDQRRSWRAELDGAVDVRFAGAEAEAAINRFVRTYPRLAAEAEADLHTVDLRYPNGFSLGWGSRREAGEKGQ